MGHLQAKRSPSSSLSSTIIIMIIAAMRLLAWLLVQVIWPFMTLENIPTDPTDVERTVQVTTALPMTHTAMQQTINQLLWSMLCRNKPPWL